jgi:hypothetical protein
MTTQRRDVKHESAFIQQGVIRRGAGKGQIWTTCTHPDCTNGNTAHLVSTDIPQLAQDAATAHLATHQRADKAD